MNVSLFQAAAALNANNRWQEIIAENLAASSLPGYKGKEISFASVQAGLMPAQNTGVPNYVLPRGEAHTNFQAGQLKFTSVKTDFAIEGPGFFEVQLPNGATGFTRDGEFHISAQGHLLTKQGYRVLGENGPVQLDPGNPAPILVGATGEISQGTQPTGKLKIVEFNDPRLLTSISGGYFLGGDPHLQIKPATDVNVRQGYLEGANVSPVAEMAHLITAMRMFEANQRVLQAHDERMGRAIAELGNVSG